METETLLSPLSSSSLSLLDFFLFLLLLSWHCPLTPLISLISNREEPHTGAVYTATVNSAHQGAHPTGFVLPFGIPFVEKLKFRSSGGGGGWSITPTIHTADFKVRKQKGENL